MTNLLIGLLSALVATNQPAAVSNLVTQTTGLKIAIPDPNDPVEKEFKQIMADDDASQAEVDGWIRENNEFAAKGGGVSPDVLNARIRKRLDVIKKKYVDFLAQHPNHARAHLAYGSFLNDVLHDDEAVDELEKARVLDPNNPAPWNQLANEYGHHGPVKKAFEYYAKAIELDPTEPVYYQNMGTTVYLFRKDAREYYNINEQQVFNKALGLYQQAMKLDPNNFELAQDVAQTYYGIQPTRTDDALNAWTNCLRVADTDIEREGVYIHLARFNLNADRFAEAHRRINQVTNTMYNDLKVRILRNLAIHEQRAASNAAPVKVEKPDAK